MSRAVWKGSFLDPSILKKMPAQVWSRGSAIPSFLVGQTIAVHNGKEFKPISVTREKVGFKFGAFITTRLFTNKYKNLKQGKKKKK